MNPKDYIKRGSLLSLSATLLFTPTIEALANEYKLKNSVQVYDQAENAKNRTNTVKTYPQGDYFIYKTHEGMINITKVEGQPGAWINPSDNLDSKPVVRSVAPEVINSEMYTVTTQLDGYFGSDHARDGVNPVTTVEPGRYYVYSSYNGMVNVTSVKGQPGAWINPNQNRNTSNNSILSNKFTLTSETLGYISAENAKDGVDSVRTVETGTYSIYKSFDGMINITTVEGVPGIWINPQSKVTKVNSYVQTPDNTVLKVTVEGEEVTISKATNVFELSYEVSGFGNASDALSGENPITTIYAGKYYVYKTYNGMLNLSKNPDTPGSWINPEVVKVVEVVNVENEVVKVEDIETTVATLPTENTRLEATEAVSLESVEETTEESVEETVEDTADETVEETKTESVDETVDESVQESVLETIEDTSQESTDIAEEVVEDSVELETSLEVKVYSIGDRYTLTEAVAGYLRAQDALLDQNSETVVEAGEYLVRKVDLGMINITKELGHPGVWISPR